MVCFDDNHGSATGFVTSEGNLQVRQLSIGRMVNDGFLPVPDFIKIDVEGGEREVLSNLKDIISSARPVMLVATHGKECRDFTENFLDENNYSFRVLNPEAVSGDTEIIAVPR